MRAVRDITVHAEDKARGAEYVTCGRLKNNARIEK